MQKKRSKGGTMDDDPLAHQIAETYFLASQTDGKDIILKTISKGPTGYNITLLTNGQDPDSINLDFEDKIRIAIEDLGISVKEIQRQKGTPGEFMKTVLDWEAALNRSLGYNAGNPDNTKEYAPQLLDLAKNMRVSDIHLVPKPLESKGSVQFRVDGKLREIARLTGDQFQELAKYFHGKLGGVKDGQPTVEGSFNLDAETQYRLSSMKVGSQGQAKNANGTLYSTVLRLLKTQQVKLHLHDLGYLQRHEQRVTDLIHERSGLILATGVTGSGKTTTIATLIEEIWEKSHGASKIITFEDPVEYQLRGATQFKVTANENPKDDDLTFEEALKNCLRQDPDVIFVGEIRNAATAKYAVDAAQTGHLILATMHAKDVTSAVTRLGLWGIDGPALNDSLLGIVYQQLIRKNCPDCLRKRKMTPDEINYFLHMPSLEEFSPEDRKTRQEAYQRLHASVHELNVAESTGIVNGIPCEQCEGLKFYGRIPLVQVYTHTMEYAPIISAIANGDPNGPKLLNEIFSSGQQIPLAVNALSHLLMFHTSPEELKEDLPRSHFKEYAYPVARELHSVVNRNGGK